ncbi:hypothetical protein [Nostoc sp.]
MGGSTQNLRSSAVHSGETIGSGLLAQIFRNSQITRDEFRELF